MSLAALYNIEMTGCLSYSQQEVLGHLTHC